MGKNQRLTITRPCRDIHINGQRRDTEERRAPTQRRIQRHQPTQGKLMGVDRLLIVVYLRRRIQLGTQHDTRTRSNKSKYSTETIVEDTTGRRLLWGGGPVRAKWTSESVANDACAKKLTTYVSHFTTFLVTTSLAKSRTDVREQQLARRRGVEC